MGLVLQLWHQLLDFVKGEQALINEQLLFNALNSSFLYQWCALIISLTGWEQIALKKHRNELCRNHYITVVQNILTFLFC